MVFWLMLYQLYGPDFLRQVFVASLDNLDFGPADLVKMIRKVSDHDPLQLASGWLVPGKYRVRQASDFGPVKYPLPGELIQSLPGIGTGNHVGSRFPDSPFLKP
jgi:hypothetical protein